MLSIDSVAETNIILMSHVVVVVAISLISLSHAAVVHNQICVLAKDLNNVHICY